MAPPEAPLPTPASPAIERPYPNTYWIEPGRLLAGEHPGAEGRRSMPARLRRLLELGVEQFIDLTQPDELPEYESLLEQLAGGGTRPVYRRFGIVDHGLPSSPAQVWEILDTLGDALDAGRCVYLHCRAGVGRTGTVLACHLMRSGLTATDALGRLAEHWRQSERSAGIPQIPETRAQHQYVLGWASAPARRALRRPPVPPAITADARLHGMFLGLAAGEAAALAAQGGPPGVWGSHTAMTLLLAESFIVYRGADPEDQMRRYLEWQQAGTFGQSALVIPVPEDVRKALASWQWTRKPWAGSHDPARTDPHPLPRTAAVAAWFRGMPAGAVDVAAECSRTTSQVPVVVDACRCTVTLLLGALTGLSREQIVGLDTGPAAAALRERALKPPIAKIIAGSWRSRPGGRDDAPGVVSAAMSALARTTSFRDGLREILQAGPGSAAAAALYGALAGAHYGDTVIAGHALAARPALSGLAQRLARVAPR